VKVERNGSVALLVVAANELVMSHSTVCARPEVGNVLFDNNRRISFRVNVSTDSNICQCDSGYLQVARSFESITSNENGLFFPWNAFPLEDITDKAREFVC
jgi:hypothetical protein